MELEFLWQAACGPSCDTLLFILSHMKQCGDQGALLGCPAKLKLEKETETRIRTLKNRGVFSQTQSGSLCFEIGHFAD